MTSTHQGAIPLTPHTPQAFPTLSAQQIARVARHGHTRSVAKGEVLIESGATELPFFVITRGRIEIVRTAGDVEELIADHGPGEFTGETNMLSGRRSLVLARASEAGEVIELERDRLLALVQTDAELSEIFVRAFIHRHVELISRGLGDAVLVGSSHCAGTHRVKEFLTRNGLPFSYIDLDRNTDVQALLDRFRIGIDDIPVLIVRGEQVLRSPSNQQIAETLGLNEGIDATQLRDLVIVGAGPSGLAAAVYGSSEGLGVLVLESSVPGGQAGSSSRIENYLGFPTGISGEELTGRAYNQALKFGADLVVARGARALACERRPYAIEMDEGHRAPARTVIIATGANYRKLPLPGIERFEGAGVYYGATRMEGQLCKGEEVIVIGGGNSAGQAAVFLADQAARHVHMLVRSEALAETMSRYLVKRIDGHPKITLHVKTELVAVEGDYHLARVRWRNETGDQETHEIRHVFVMTGALPCTDWLQGCVALDPKGFIKTGPDLSSDDLQAAGWPLARAPYLLETSLPGVFAVGDVRGGNIKRVASAVGEGSIAVAFVHRVLQE